MVDFKNRLENLLEHVMKEHFLGLCTLEIWLDTEKDTDELMGYGELTGEGYYIDVDEQMKEATDQEIEGGFAHELAHILIDAQKTYLQRVWTDIIYGIGTKYKRKDKELKRARRLINNWIYKPFANYVTEDERGTDLLAVERGCGEKLLAFLKFHDKIHDKYKAHGGLTVSELSDHLEKKR